MCTLEELLQYGAAETEDERDLVQVVDVVQLEDELRYDFVQLADDDTQVEDTYSYTGVVEGVVQYGATELVFVQLVESEDDEDDLVQLVEDDEVAYTGA